MSAHYVYQVYDEYDQLIYVGCTVNLFGRLKAYELPQHPTLPAEIPGQVTA